MVNFVLSRPVFLPAQLDGLAEKLGCTAEELAALARAEMSVITDRENPPLKPDGTPRGVKYDIVRMWDVPGVSKEDAKCLEDAEGKFLYGADGVQWLCEEKGVECPEPVMYIKIPYQAYYEATDRQWLSISQFAAEVESRSLRIANLCEMGGPEVLLMLEYRQLWERVEQLEVNKMVPRRWSDGTIMRSLSDIGYSLSRGWLNAQEEFEIEEDGPYQEEESGVAQ